MAGWSELVTHPLGIAAFALVLLFSLLVKVREPAWLRKIIVSMAVILATLVVGGGLFLAYKQESREKAQPTLYPGKIEQRTTGDNSPPVAGVEGNVNIEIEQGAKRK